MSYHILSDVMTVLFREKKLIKAMMACTMMAISNAALTNNATTDIGNSYFEQNGVPSKQNNLNEGSKPNNPSGSGQNSGEHIDDSFFTSHHFKTQPITQVGLSDEQHQDYNVAFLFLNRLFKNNVFCELRANSVYHYRSQNPPEPPIVTSFIPFSSERNLLGYGGVGIIGYNIDVNAHISVMPFVRVQAFTNTAVAYKDTYGNEVKSANYAAFLGGKLSMRVTKNFATYVQYFAGHQTSILSGQGIYASTIKASINAFTSILEFGLPYQINKKWSVSPYMQFITATANPNGVGLSQPYNLSGITTTSSVYALRIGYVI